MSAPGISKTYLRLPSCENLRRAFFSSSGWPSLSQTTGLRRWGEHFCWKGFIHKFRVFVPTKDPFTLKDSSGSSDTEISLRMPTCQVSSWIPVWTERSLRIPFYRKHPQGSLWPKRSSKIPLTWKLLGDPFYWKDPQEPLRPEGSLRIPFYRIDPQGFLSFEMIIKDLFDLKDHQGFLWPERSSRIPFCFFTLRGSGGSSDTEMSLRIPPCIVSSCIPLYWKTPEDPYLLKRHSSISLTWWIFKNPFLLQDPRGSPSTDGSSRIPFH